MSKLETNTIDTISGSSTLTIGDSNTTAISVGSPISNGLTLSDNILFNAASKGIYLGVTTATASNLLDDYEEGTWTPSYEVDTGAFGTITYQAATIGRYTKIGNIVYIVGRIDLNTTFAKGTASGNVYITGLPFTVDNTNGSNDSFPVSQQSGWNNAPNQMFARSDNRLGMGDIDFGGSGYDTTTLNDMATSGRNRVAFSGFYKT